MRFKIPGLRRAGVAAVAAVTAGTALAALTATPAFAASPPAGISTWTGPPTAPAGIAATSTPVILAGAANQTAGNWTIAVDGTTFKAGDSILLKIEDSDDPGTDVNCNSAIDYVAFHGTPTVAVTSATPSLGIAQVTTALASSVACGANTRSDAFRITFTNGSNTFPQQLLTVTGVAYDSGTAVAGGSVAVLARGCSSTDATCTPNALDATFTYTNSATTGAGGSSNATITLATVSANVPPVGLPPATANQAVSNVVITESQAGALATGTAVCLDIQSPPSGTDDGSTGPGAVTPPVLTPTSTPSVAAGDAALVNNGNGGPNGSSAPLSFGNYSETIPATTSPFDEAGFIVAQASSTATTFTISGLKLDTGTAAGAIIFGVGIDPGGSLATACVNAVAATLGAPIFGSDFGAVVAGTIVSVARIFGADRYGTAASIFSGFGCVANAAVARGDLFPDALAASYLAGSLGGKFTAEGEDGAHGTGILLTTTASVPAITLAALRQAGVTNIFIVGGSAAVSDAVAQQLQATPAYACGGGTQVVGADGNPVFLKVTRLGGATRYDTAELVAESPTAALISTTDLDGDTTANPVKTAILASGANFPDAVAAGPMAYAGNNASSYWDDSGCGEDAVCNGGTKTKWGTGADSGSNGFPLLLTDPASLSTQAQNGLLNLGITRVIVMGGTAAVAANIDTQLAAIGLQVTRLAGTDRADTAAKAAALEQGTFSDPPSPGGSCDADGTPATCTMPNGLFYRTDHVNVARGDNFADALAGSPHAGGIDAVLDVPGGCTFSGSAPVLLTIDPATIGAATSAYLNSHSAPKVSNVCDGGTPDGGITSVDIFGGPVAVTNATAGVILNALT